MSAEAQKSDVSAPPGPPHRPDRHDGIHENDNFLPRWWLMTLFGAILFSLGYWFYYHALKVGPLQADELAADEKRLAETRDKAIAAKINDESLASAAKDSALVARGEATYRANCVACHGEKAEGKIGPNLTDPFWIHGSKPTDIFRTVSKGVPEKGMLAWESLGAARLQEVVAFVITRKNTNVAGKEPQGKKE